MPQLDDFYYPKMSHSLRKKELKKEETQQAVFVPLASTRRVSRTDAAFVTD